MRRMWPLFAVALLLGLSTLAMLITRVRQASLPSPPAVAVPAQWRDVRAGHLHSVHLEQAEVACASCHGEDGFTSPPRSRCEACHADRAQIQHARIAGATAGAEDASECIACHAFGASSEPSRWACQRCHSRPQGALAAISVHADQDCGTCHAPHAVEPTAAAADCTSCHALAQDTAHPGCRTCHGAHAEAAVAQEGCVGCHGPTHGRLAAEHGPCTTCHTPHAFAAQQTRRCESCHSTVRALGHASSPAHRRCQSCHGLDDRTSRPGDRVCRRCHEQSSGHRVQHLPAGAAKESACVDCHPAHPSPRQRLQGPHLACTTCHGDRADQYLSGVHDDSGGHGGAASCSDCHRPHRFSVATSATFCGTCHQEQGAAVSARSPAAHQACAACHREHAHALDAESPAAARGTCRPCHADVDAPKGHERCVSCHDAHGGQVDRDRCGQCHRPVLAEARPGHRDCLACHAPHRGGAGEKLVTREQPALCTGCHQPARLGPHASQCVSCHDAHSGGSAAPERQLACGDCHQGPRRGLHQLAEHGTCGDCHGAAHADPRVGQRATCVGCHRDQRDHEPDANTCDTCHLFR